MKDRLKALTSIAIAMVAAALLAVPMSRAADPVPATPKVAAPKPAAPKMAAAAIELPPSSLGDHSIWVAYIDVPAITAESGKAAGAALRKALPEKLLNANGADPKAMDEDTQSMVDLRKAWLDSGAEVLVIAGDIPGVGGVDAGNGPAPEKAGGTSLKAPDDAVGAPPAGGPPVPMSAFVRLKAGTTPKAFASAFKVSGGKVLAAEKARKKDKGGAAAPDMDISKLGAESWGGQWAYLTNEGLMTPKKAAAGKVAAQFASALARQSGAPIRLAFRLNGDVKKQLQDLGDGAANNPAAGMFAGLIQPLMNLDTGTLAITLGEAPKLSFDLNFADADSAAEFKQGMDTLSGIATMFIQQQQAAAAKADPTTKALTPQQLRTTLAPLTLKQTSATLSTQLDTKFLQSLKEMGVLDNLPMGGPGGPGGPGAGPGAGPGSDDAGSPPVGPGPQKRPNTPAPAKKNAAPGI